MVDVSPRRLWILRFGALFAWQGLRRLRSWRHDVGSAGLPLKRRLSDLSKGSWVRPCALGLSNGWSPQNGLPDRLDGSSVGPWALELVGRPHVCGLCCRGVCSYGCSDRRVCCSLDLCVCGNLLAGVTRGDPCQGSLSCSAWARAGRTRRAGRPRGCGSTWRASRRRQSRRGLTSSPRRATTPSPRLRRGRCGAVSLKPGGRGRCYSSLSRTRAFTVF